MPQDSPSVIIISGPNGAGKSTAAPLLLKRHLQVSTFINADEIAGQMCPSRPEDEAAVAGRAMLAKLRELAAARRNFAFETTLASRTFAPWLRSLIATGYHFQLAFVWLPDPEMAVQRVARRVQLGGHSVPPDDIRRRYQRGLINLFELYLPLAHHWTIYDNSPDGEPSLIATGSGERVGTVANAQSWRTISLWKNRP